MAQHVWSEGKTSYNAFAGAVIITTVLFLLHLGVFAVTRLHKNWHALTYLPSFLSLAVLTSVDENITADISLGVWKWILPPVLLVYAGVVSSGRELEQYDSVSITDGRLWRTAWINVLSMCLMIIVTGLIGNGNRHLHQRLRIENLIKDGHYEEALSVADKTAVTDSSITMLRFYALSHTGQLGDKLFTYPLKGGADVVMPNDSTVKLLIIDRQTMRQHYKQRHFYNTMLPAKYLLGKNLDAFAYQLSQQDSTLSILPRHYREALVLYNRVRNYPLVTYRDSVLEADFADFNELLRSTDKKERKQKARKTYGNTYWYYYKFE